MTDQRVDVAVIGGGVVGLATALAAASTGLRIAIFDANDSPAASESGRGIHDWDRRVTALTPASVKFLESLGVWQSILDTRRIGSYTDMIVWDAEGTGQIQFSASDLHIDALGHIVESSITTRALVHRAEAYPNVDIHWNTRLEGLSIREHDVALETSNGATIAAELVIGADGGRSKSRGLAQIRTREWRYHQNAIVATIKVNPGHDKACWQAFLPTGPLALLPLAEPDVCSIVWSLDEDLSQRWVDATDDDFLGGLNRALSDRGPRAIAVGARQAFPLVQCHAVDYSRGRFVLVGDAAHAIHPLAGQGINLGLSDAHVLGEEIVRVHQRRGEWWSSQTMKRYERQRKGENLSMMAMMQAFKWGFGSRNPALTMMRNWGLNSVDTLPMAKKWFVEQATGSS